MTNNPYIYVINHIEMKFSTILLAASALLLAACGAEPASEDYAAFVNPKIGTGGHGHVFVGANVPFGFVQLGPTSIPQSWDWCSGYHDSDRTVIGFSHTHLSGTGIGDLFDITVMPTTGPTAPARGSEKDPASGAWSYADRTKEICEPGYYSVPLERYGITAEMTATARVGFHRYTFPATDQANLVFDLENGGCWDDVTDAGFEVVKDDAGHVKALGGYRFSTGWARNQKVFFWAEFSRPSVEFAVAENPNNDSERKRVRKPIYGYYGLGKVEEGTQVLVKVALSPVSIEGAKANMAAELPGWDFEATKADARKAWNEELGRVAVTCPDADTKTVFYTALYHTMVAPSVFNDVDGQYRGSDDVVRQGDFQNYTTFSLWDTYRAQMPLMTLIHADRCNDITATFYHIFEQQGDLPVWHLMGNETDCMVGNPGLIAFADNIVKGFQAGLTREQMIEAMTKTATTPDRGQNFRMEYGYIPADLYRESVASPTTWNMPSRTAPWRMPPSSSATRLLPPSIATAATPTAISGIRSCSSCAAARWTVPSPSPSTRSTPATRPPTTPRVPAGSTSGSFRRTSRAFRTCSVPGRRCLRNWTASSRHRTTWKVRTPPRTSPASSASMPTATSPGTTPSICTRCWASPTRPRTGSVRCTRKCISMTWKASPATRTWAR